MCVVSLLWSCSSGDPVILASQSPAVSMASVLWQDADPRIAAEAASLVHAHSSECAWTAVSNDNVRPSLPTRYRCVRACMLDSPADSPGHHRLCGSGCAVQTDHSCIGLNIKWLETKASLSSLCLFISLINSTVEPWKSPDHFRMYIKVSEYHWSFPLGTNLRPLMCLGSIPKNNKYFSVAQV